MTEDDGMSVQSHEVNTDVFTPEVFSAMTLHNWITGSIFVLHFRKKEISHFRVQQEAIHNMHSVNIIQLLYRLSETLLSRTQTPFPWNFCHSITIVNLKHSLYLEHKPFPLELLSSQLLSFISNSRYLEHKAISLGTFCQSIINVYLKPSLPRSKTNNTSLGTFLIIYLQPLIY